MVPMTSPDILDRSREIVDWGVADRPFPGEIESGDQYVVASCEGGVLAAVIDGLGHGAEAAVAARRAARLLSDEAGRPIRELVDRCHAALRSSRGAVMTIAAIDAENDLLTWTGVGNVEAVLLRAAEDAVPGREAIVSRAGVVGYQLPPLREVTLTIARGDVLVLATDGINRDFILESPLQMSAQGYASHLLDKYGEDKDDALILVARYLGRSP
jgi:hypothetical protein